MRPSRYQGDIWKLCAIRMLFWMHFFAAVLTPFYMTWGGLKLSQMLCLNAWFMLCGMLFEAPTGTVADYLGRKASLVLGSLVGAVAALLYVSMPNFYLFMLAEAVFAVAYTLHSGADEALACDSLLADETPERTKTTLLRMESFKLAGIVTTTTLGGFIAARFGLTAPMAAYVAPAIAACLLALTLKEPGRERAKAERPSCKNAFSGRRAAFPEQ